MRLHTFDVHDDEHLVNVFALHSAAHRRNVCQEPLILLDMIHNHPLFRGDFIDPLGVNLAQMLNGHRPSHLVCHVVSLRVHLQVVLPLGEVEVLQDRINFVLCSPLQVRNVHAMGLREIILASSQEA